MPEGDLLTWCDHDPTTRYPAIAAAITTCGHTKQGELPRWTGLSLQLLDRAPTRIEVLKQYVAQMELTKWRVPAETTLANITLLDTLRTHIDPSLEWFIVREIARLERVVDAQRRTDREAERERDERFE
jgi:DNA-binding transcriptional regulator YdaS (Cro superfamily)